MLSHANLEYKAADFCQEAERHLSNGEYDVALSLSNRALELDNQSAKPYLIRGNVYYYSDAHLNLNEAIFNYRLAQMLCPATGEGATIKLNANVSLAAIYLGKKWFDEAIECASQALEDLPTTPDILFSPNTIYFMRARAYERRGMDRTLADKKGIRQDLEKAISDYQKTDADKKYTQQLTELLIKLPSADAIALQPMVTRNPKAHCIQAKIYHEQKNVVEMAKSCNEALKLDPKYLKAYLIRAHAYLQQEMNEKALWDCQLIIAYQALFPTLPAKEIDMAFHCLGVAHFRLGQLNQAISCFEKNIDFATTNPLAFCNRGAAYSQQERFAEAFIDFHKTLELVSTLGLPSLNYIGDVALIKLETLLEQKSQRELFKIIQTIQPIESQLKILKDCVENKKSVFGKRFWKKEGLLPPNLNREGSSLYEINAYYQKVKAGNLAPQKPVMKSTGMLASIRMTFLPPPENRPGNEIEMNKNPDENAGNRLVFGRIL